MGGGALLQLWVILPGYRTQKCVLQITLDHIPVSEGRIRGNLGHQDSLTQPFQYVGVVSHSFKTCLVENGTFPKLMSWQTNEQEEVMSSLYMGKTWNDHCTSGESASYIFPFS